MSDSAGLPVLLGRKSLQERARSRSLCTTKPRWATRLKRNKLVGQTNGAVWLRTCLHSWKGEAVGQLSRLPTSAGKGEEQKGQPATPEEGKKNEKKSSSLFSQSPKMVSSHGLCCSVTLADARDISRTYTDRKKEVEQDLFFSFFFFHDLQSCEFCFVFCCFFFSKVACLWMSLFSSGRKVAQFPRKEHNTTTWIESTRLVWTFLWLLKENRMGSLIQKKKLYIAPKVK